VNTDTIFHKIIRGEIPSEKIHEDEKVIAIRDIRPAAPVHILVIPRKTIPTVNDIEVEDKELVGHMVFIAGQIAKKLGIETDGYRLVFNCNTFGGQEIYQLHLHLLGGQQLPSFQGMQHE
jgi:histidine triad (HIT) family protein